MARTELQKLIADKWFLSTKELSQQTGVSVKDIIRAIKGEKMYTDEAKLREFLEKL